MPDGVNAGAEHVRASAPDYLQGERKSIENTRRWENNWMRDERKEKKERPGGGGAFLSSASEFSAFY